MMKKLTLLILVGFTVMAQAFADEVSVSGRKILVNNSNYIIKGICYNPVPKGSSSRDFSSLTEDINLMKEAGVNTIRVYSPIDDVDVLDELAENGIKIIISFGYNRDGEYDILSGSFIDYIIKYKDHDAILLWEFGNEYNYHPEWFGDDINNWYTAMNDAALDAKLEDDNHPTATAHGEMPDANALSKGSQIDVWGLNVYRWDKPRAIFTEWESTSSKPMYLSEAGADSYMTQTVGGYEEGENESAQADATRNILEDVFTADEICSGVTLFEFSDEWWKAGDPDTHDTGGWAPNSSGVPYDGSPNEEYWGIVDVDRNKKEAFDVVKEIYTAISVSVSTIFDYEKTSIYPNPVADQLNIHHIASNCDKLEVIDVTGKIHYTYDPYESPSLSSNVSELPRGVYFLKAYSQGNQEVIRFVKM